MEVIEVGFCCVAEDIQFIEGQQHSCQDTLFRQCLNNYSIIHFCLYARHTHSAEWVWRIELFHMASGLSTVFLHVSLPVTQLLTTIRTLSVRKNGCLTPALAALIALWFNKKEYCSI